MRSYSISNYFKALECLIDEKPTIVAKGAPITNDAVSLEAGRKKGSIKKSRPEFASLINAINEAASKQKSADIDPDAAKIERLENGLKEMRKSLSDSHEREASLVYEIFSLRKKLAKISGSKVFPIRGQSDKI